MPPPEYCIADANCMMMFARDGTELFAGCFGEAECITVEDALANLPRDRAGVRIGSAPALRPMLSPEGAIGAMAARLLGHPARPVRAIFFDKTAVTYWGLGWHQDRTIVVQKRAAVDGFGPWTIKAGLTQVEPPFAVLEAMATMRIHLDPVDENNAPLGIVPGSHRLGRFPEAGITAVVERSNVALCLAARGDVWA